MMPRSNLDVLVVTTSFSPENAIGAVRLSKIVKYLVRQGHRVTVVSPTLDEDVPRDPSLECGEFDEVRRIGVSQSRWFDRLFASRRKRLLRKGSAASFITNSQRDPLAVKFKASLARYVHFAYTMLRNWDWSRQALRQPIGKHGAYDLVLSSYPSLGAMWAAGAIRRRGAARRWIADFRDPVNYANRNALLFRLNGLIQAAILKRADRAVAVSHGVLRKFDPRYMPKCSVLPNGYDPDDRPPVAPNTDPGVLKLCYTGSLHGGARDLGPLFEALAGLSDRGGVPTTAFRFEYAGKDFAILRQQAAGFAMESILVDRGYVTREASLGMQMAADLIVVATWNTADDQGIMTGKLFECFLMRKPVVGLVGGELGGSEFRAVVERVGAGIAIEPDAGARAAELARLGGFLAQASLELQREGRVAAAYNHHVEEYGYPSITDSLVAAAVDLCTHR